MYAYFKRLDYFSTECLYAPYAARGYARDFVKDLEVRNDRFFCSSLQAVLYQDCRGGGIMNIWKLKRERVAEVLQFTVPPRTISSLRKLHAVLCMHTGCASHSHPGPHSLGREFPIPQPPSPPQKWCSTGQCQQWWVKEWCSSW